MFYVPFYQKLKFSLQKDEALDLPALLLSFIISFLKFHLFCAAFYLYIYFYMHQPKNT